VDPFDEVILAALQDGKPRVFTQLRDATGIGHNTLRLHLENLANQGLVVKEKTPATGLGRPKFAYLIPQKVRQQVSAALSDPFIEIIALPFSRLKHLCRFEKAGTASKPKRDAKLRTALKSKSKNRNHFTPFWEHARARKILPTQNVSSEDYCC